MEVRLSKDEAQGYQEVWLIAPDPPRLVSLGVMNSGQGTFALPAGQQNQEAGSKIKKLAGLNDWPAPAVDFMVVSAHN